MKKSVTVIERSEGRIKVGCDATVCSGCKSEMFCRGRDTTFEVENPKGFKVEKGDRIIVDVPEGYPRNREFLGRPDIEKLKMELTMQLRKGGMKL